MEEMTRHKSIINNSSTLSKISENVTKYLNNVLPGALGRIDWHTLRIHRVKFMQLLIRDPVKAYEVVLDVYGENEEQAKHIIYMVLKGLFLNYREFVDKAYQAVTQGDTSGFHEVLEEFLRRMRA